MTDWRWVGGGGRLTWYGDPGFSTFMRRAFAKGMGYTDEDLGRPIIGICNTWSELNHCNSHLREIAEAVKRGVWQAGGWPSASCGAWWLNRTRPTEAERVYGGSRQLRQPVSMMTATGYITFTESASGAS